MCRHLFYPFLPRRRGGLHALEHRVSKLEHDMSDTKSALLAKLEALQAQVTQHTTDEGNKLAEAVAAARAAQQKEDKTASDAELADALAKIDEISRGLVDFSPSAN